MSHISRVFHFAIFRKIKREDREFAEKLVLILGTRTQRGAMEAMIVVASHANVLRGSSRVRGMIAWRTRKNVCVGGYDRRVLMENATFCIQDLAKKGLFYGFYLWKCFFPRSVSFFDKLIHRCNCKSLECWPRSSRCIIVPQRCLRRFGYYNVYR